MIIPLRQKGVHIAFDSIQLTLFVIVLSKHTYKCTYISKSSLPLPHQYNLHYIANNPCMYFLKALERRYSDAGIPKI